MDTTMQDTLLFFDHHKAAYPLYEQLQERLLARFPESRVKVQKSQISLLQTMQTMQNQPETLKNAVTPVLYFAKH